MKLINIVMIASILMLIVLPVQSGTPGPWLGRHGANITLDDAYIHGLLPGVLPGDAPNLAQTWLKLNKSGDTLGSNLATGGYKIIGSANGVNATDLMTVRQGWDKLNESGGNMTGALYVVNGTGQAAASYAQLWDNRDYSVSYDGIIKQKSTTYYGINGAGTVISSGTNFGAVFNSLVDSLRSGQSCPATIAIDCPSATTTSPCYLYSELNVIGIGRPHISTATDIPLFESNASAYHSGIAMRGLYLSFTGVGHYTSRHIEIYNASYNYFDEIHTMMPNTHYDITNHGGILLDGTSGTTWLNYITKSHLSQVTLRNSTDNWIDKNSIVNWEMTNWGINLIGTCNNAKITDNHIICPSTSTSPAGIYIASPQFGLKVTGTWFEPQDAWSSGEFQDGIISDGLLTFCDFSGNHFNSLGGAGMNFNGGISYSTVLGNDFYNVNLANNAGFRCISAGSGAYNTISNNVAYANGQTTKSQFLWGTDYSSYSANIINGDFSDDIVVLGTGSKENGTISVLH